MLYKNKISRIVVNGEEGSYKLSSSKSEANLIATLLKKLKEEGLKAESEVNLYRIKGRKDNGKRNRAIVCRFDIVVFNCFKEAKIIIECKRKKKRNRGLEAQIKKYKSFGVPVVTCLGASEIENCVKRCKALAL